MNVHIVKVSVHCKGDGHEITTELIPYFNDGWTVAGVFPVGLGTVKNYYAFFILLTKPH